MYIKHNILLKKINLFRCQEMAGNCGMCLSLDPKYQCGWCEVLFIHSFYFSMCNIPLFLISCQPLHMFTILIKKWTMFFYNLVFYFLLSTFFWRILVKFRYLLLGLTTLFSILFVVKLLILIYPVLQHLYPFVLEKC